MRSLVHGNRQVRRALPTHPARAVLRRQPGRAGVVPQPGPMVRGAVHLRARLVRRPLRRAELRERKARGGRRVVRLSLRLPRRPALPDP